MTYTINLPGRIFDLEEDPFRSKAHLLTLEGKILFSHEVSTLETVLAHRIMQLEQAAARRLPGHQITALALANGFKLRPQPDGSEALNPYVFDFAHAIRGAKHE